MMSPRSITWSLAALMLPVLALHARAAGADGDTDPAFGDGNQVLVERPVEFGNGQAWVGDVATLADGRIVWTMENGIGGLWVARMLRDGQPDPSFAVGGLLVLDACVSSRPARLVAFEDGGALVWAGACLVRVLADGTVDAGFVAASGGPSPDFFAARLLRDHQGRWLLAGTEGQDWQVYRFLADGALDTAFAGGGMATIDTPSTNGTRALNAMALRPDGRIVVAGLRANAHGTNLVLAGLDPDGAQDGAFGDAGIVDVDAPTGYNSLRAQAIVVDRDGSLVVGGDANNGMQSCCVLFARFDAGGAIDPAGLRIFPLGPNVTLSPFGETSTSLALLPHGKVLLVRVSFPFVVTTRTRFTLVRMHRDGGLDLGFNDVGWRSYVVTDPSGQGQSGPYSQIHGMAYANGEALMFGRTFFEDEALGPDYVTLMRARFDALFADAFD